MNWLNGDGQRDTKMMVIEAATLAVALLKAVALLALVPSMYLITSIGAFSSEISSCGLHGHCWYASCSW